MIGIAVGIAAVLSCYLGSVHKIKILAGYAELGVNTMVFYGYLIGIEGDRRSSCPLSLSIGTGTFIFKEDIS